MPAMADGHVAQRKAQEAADDRCGNRRNVEYVPHNYDNCAGKRSQGIKIGARNDRNVHHENVTQHATADTG